MGGYLQNTTIGTSRPIHRRLFIAPIHTRLFIALISRRLFIAAYNYLCLAGPLEVRAIGHELWVAIVPNGPACPEDRMQQISRVAPGAA